MNIINIKRSASVLQATLAKIALFADAGQDTINGDAAVLALVTALRSYKSLNGNNLILIRSRKSHTLYCAKPAANSTNFITIEGAS
jgi:hypothetical protein